MRRVAVAILISLAFSSAALAETQQQFDMRVHATLARQVNVPKALRGEQSAWVNRTVVVTFRLGRDGRIEDAQVTNMTLSPRLNRKVIQIFQAAPPIRNMPDWAAGRRYRIPIKLMRDRTIF